MAISHYLIVEGFLISLHFLTQKTKQILAQKIKIISSESLAKTLFKKQDKLI